ncbi:unnamed protein product [Moneuplotes crassus]|uniref:Uncharacterized protein n=1 Tax=Euplotes crassus TaxID=5936 RepID=A0AAD1XKE3_EUPCR|nr:unnamed protein product [Moneuplotes crassus]
MESTYRVINGDKVFRPCRYKRKHKETDSDPDLKEQPSSVPNPTPPQVLDQTAPSKPSEPLKIFKTVLSDPPQIQKSLNSLISVPPTSPIKIPKITAKSPPRPLKTIENALMCLTKSCMSSTHVSSTSTIPWLPTTTSTWPGQPARATEEENVDLQSCVKALADLSTYVDKAVAQEKTEPSPKKRFKFEAKKGEDLVEQEVSADALLLKSLQTTVKNQTKELSMLNKRVYDYKHQGVHLQSIIEKLRKENSNIKRDHEQALSKKIQEERQKYQSIIDECFRIISQLESQKAHPVTKSAGLE